MAETKRKTRDDGSRQRSSSKKPKTSKKGKSADKAERRGPRLPNALRKELDRLNPRTADSDEEIGSDEEALGQDLYEYEEGLPEEESKKNRRFDPVDNLDYELPEDFEDENVSSDDDNEARNGGESEADDEVKEENDGRRIGEMPTQTVEGRRKKMNNVVVSEAYPESEYNPTRDMLEGEGALSIGDLLDPLQGKHGYSKLKKRVRILDKKSTPIQAPLPKPVQQRLERNAAYDKSKEELRKWEPIVKRNREAPTIYFDDDRDLGPSSVGTIASEFEPRTEFEKKMASLLYDDEVMDAHRKDGSRLLELNKVSAEDEKDRQNRIAKMRSLLFRHELKSKHIKNIKSKTYHRLLKKDKLKANSLQSQMDPEASKELAMKQEYERAKERMTLRHKGSSKWAKRIKERGLDVQDDGTRAAIAEQQHLHAQLTRKMNSMKDSDTSSNDTSDDDDVDVNSDDEDRASKLLEKAKEKTLKLLNEDNEVPNSGVLSLPFMNEAAAEEAKLALQEYESWANQLGDSGGGNPKVGRPSGRMVFNGKDAPESSKKTKSDNKNRSDNYYGDSDSDSEDDLEPISISQHGKYRSNELMKDANISPVLLHEDSENHKDSFFKQNTDGSVQDPGPQATHEVSIFASGTWRKMKNGNDANANANAKKSPAPLQSVELDQSVQEPVKDLDVDSDADSEGQMVDGVLSAVPEPSYELPSQEELIRQAFAADNVEDEFKKTKEDILNEENPEPEKPVLLPGWGQWTNIQKKKGIPSYMQIEHDSAKKKREEALKQRKDANLKHVIISEKPPNKKSQNLFTQSLPYPFTSKEVFEQSIRMPLGPEFNPASMVGALNRPEVVKKSGVIIKPIEFEEVNAYEKLEGHKKSGQKHKKNRKSKSNSNSGKNMTKLKTK
ncbi:putative small-subunit processome, Utp14 protein [Rosa chinensis]|uniref:Putative small-subunit processome, Utp14 protein n=1 Tax=Rosa chinensis TaxID=74649 RepID=A0A2P6PWT7_ROSCH|nr:putative small-subunit processome, Utp14 protein [Rosa chinensis]